MWPFCNIFGGNNTVNTPKPTQAETKPLIDTNTLRAILPNCRNPDSWAQALSEVLPNHNITTRLSLASFISQCAVESAQFNIIEENLNYSAEALMRTWPSRFTSRTTADAFARNPRMIANKVYSNRMGNGSEDSGEGWKYRGRGLIQVTGKNNYTACSRFMFGDLRLLDTPELLTATNRNALESACWFWVSNDLNKHSGDVGRTTRIVNGGTHGIDERRRIYNVALKHLP
jgi:putative chitinase